NGTKENLSRTTRVIHGSFTSIRANCVPSMGTLNHLTCTVDDVSSGDGVKPAAADRVARQQCRKACRAERIAGSAQLDEKRRRENIPCPGRVDLLDSRRGHMVRFPVEKHRAATGPTRHDAHLRPAGHRSCRVLVAPHILYAD